jgi:hypothetical protein
MNSNKITEWFYSSLWFAIILFIAWCFMFGMTFVALVIVNFLFENLGFMWTSICISLVFTLRFIITVVLPKLK